MSNEVWRLLRRNMSVAQLAGYALANLAGLLIIMAGLQLYRDITSDNAGRDALSTDDFIIISPKVEGFGSLLQSPRSFEEKDIKEISSQPWALSVGDFKSADFSVDAGVSFDGRSMSTNLFLESVPDEYVDVSVAGWNFDPVSSKEIPVILSKDYLTLYNFGFAPSRGLPRISESMASIVPLLFTLSGNGRQMQMQGRIVGFSSRLNTIAVPEKFLSWANEQFGQQVSSSPSRLIVKVDNPGNPAIEKYLDDHDYEISGAPNDSARAGYLMKIVLMVVLMIGLIFSVLSISILFLSISLLLQRNKKKIASLILLGYKPGTISGYYGKVIVWLNITILICASVALILMRYAWSGLLVEAGLQGCSPIAVVALGAIIMVIVTVINIVYIRRIVASCR